MAKADAQPVALPVAQVAELDEVPAETLLPIRFAKRASKSPSSNAKHANVSSAIEAEIDPTMVARTRIALTTTIAVATTEVEIAADTVAATIAVDSTETIVLSAKADLIEKADTAIAIIEEATDLTTETTAVEIALMAETGVDTEAATIAGEIDPMAEIGAASTVAIDPRVTDPTTETIAAETDPMAEIEADSTVAIDPKATDLTIETTVAEIDPMAVIEAEIGVDTEAATTVVVTDLTAEIGADSTAVATVRKAIDPTTETIAVEIDPMVEIGADITVAIDPRATDRTTATIAAEIDLMVAIGADLIAVATDRRAIDLNDPIDRTVIEADSTETIVRDERVDSTEKAATDLKAIVASDRTVRTGLSDTAESKTIGHRNRCAHRSPMPTQPKRTKTATDSTFESPSLVFVRAERQSN